MKYISKILIYILNSMAGLTFLFSLCIVSEATWKAFAIMILSGLWLVGYGVIHDMKLERAEGGAKE